MCEKVSKQDSLACREVVGREGGSDVRMCNIHRDEKGEGVAGTLNLHNIHMHCWTRYLINWFACLNDCQIFCVSLFLRNRDGRLDLLFQLA